MVVASLAQEPASVWIQVRRSLSNEWQSRLRPGRHYNRAGRLRPARPQAPSRRPLPPGSPGYSAGLNNGTGIGLVEVYDRGGTP